MFLCNLHAVINPQKTLSKLQIFIPCLERGQVYLSIIFIQNDDTHISVSQWFFKKHDSRLFGLLFICMQYIDVTSHISLSVYFCFYSQLFLNPLCRVRSKQFMLKCHILQMQQVYKDRKAQQTISSTVKDACLLKTLTDCL